MNYAQPGAIIKFRETTHRHKAPVSLRPKYCGCGKRVIAKQLTQYGRCDKCWSASRNTPEQAMGPAA